MRLGCVVVYIIKQKKEERKTLNRPTAVLSANNAIYDGWTNGENTI
jgi:hypothetical protein